MIIRSLSIGKRSTFAFATVGLVVLLLGLFSLNRISNLSDEFDIITEHRIPALSYSQNMMAALYEVRFEVVKIMLSPDEINEGRALLQAAENNFVTELNNMKSVAHADEARGLVDQITNLFEQYTVLQRQILDAVINDSQSVSALQAQAKTVGDKLGAAIEELEAFQTQRVVDSDNTVDAAEGETTAILVSAIIAALILVVLFSYFFTRSLVVPLNNAIKAAQTIADGDLTKDFDDQANDESAAMIRALAAMQDKLRQTINEIQSSASQLAATSEELSIVTEQSTKAIYDQNVELEQAVSSVTELSSAVDEVARNAVSTSEESQSANKRSELGQQEVNTTVETVTGLLNELDGSITGVASLEEQVSNIGKVLDVIRDIAEQTNLLALNAAIEAARAGESGRGFAVVADEVRGLAHRTHESTIEIETMINSVQKNTDSTVSSIRSSHEKAKNTLEVAQRAGEALAAIKRSVANINEQNTAIASAAEQQSIVSTTVDEGLVKIRDIANGTAAAADQSSASSQELARLAESLNNLTNQFKV
ncbi:methyl-accepting chemotaxis protein [Marinomonas ostreistagni]|uniref:methyl-accepting chemotaxis protein n=1 Tax=Marinomonas ostreistagni TaxID=359209 RepID=UPI00194F2326|nr:methyl-accepting chemotaxis protein [Marinomonas ostreistagni]MBM6551088.1 methyl-accepting chemotaxis protein [Marinomonas ostreistagni]